MHADGFPFPLLHRFLWNSQLEYEYFIQHLDLQILLRPVV